LRRELRKYPGVATPDGPTVAALVQALIGDELPAVNVDVIGVGASVYDILTTVRGLPVAGINVGEGSKARDRSGKLGFLNLRAEAYWKLREALDPDLGHGLALPPDRELLADLCAPKWSLTARGIQVESKEDIKKRLGRSTDCADAVVLAHYFVPPVKPPAAAPVGTTRQSTWRGR
jgi:hypothetical protein